MLASSRKKSRAYSASRRARSDSDRRWPLAAAATSATWSMAEKPTRTTQALLHGHEHTDSCNRRPVATFERFIHVPYTGLNHSLWADSAARSAIDTPPHREH